MGLNGFNSCTLQALEVLKNVDFIFVESYTNFFSQEKPEVWKQIPAKIIPITRKDIEDEEDTFLEKIKGKSAAILISGDPFVATTHNSIRIAAMKRDYNCKLIHNSSVISAAASVSGLSSYSFGRTVTCPFRTNKSEFPYRIIQQNKTIDAHTLVLLDIDILENKFLSIDEAISILFDLETEIQENVINDFNIGIGLAKLGYQDEFTKAGSLEDVANSTSWLNIGPPQALIICADKLHFAEVEALAVLWGVKNPIKNTRND